MESPTVTGIFFFFFCFSFSTKKIGADLGCSDFGLHSALIPTPTAGLGSAAPQCSAIPSAGGVGTAVVPPPTPGLSWELEPCLEQLSPSAPPAAPVLLSSLTQVCGKPSLTLTHPQYFDLLFPFDLL